MASRSSAWWPEEVKKVSPDLVTRDDEGKAYTARYEAVNAMLLNEFLKEHRKIEEQQAMITEMKAAMAQQQKEIKALATSLREQAVAFQKVNDQLKTDRSTSELLVNN